MAIHKKSKTTTTNQFKINRAKGQQDKIGLISIHATSNPNKVLKSKESTRSINEIGQGIVFKVSLTYGTR